MKREVKKQGRPFTSEEIRFWAKVNKEGPIPPGMQVLGPCWLWTASCFNTGYGSFSYNYRNIGAHVWAWYDRYGQIPAGLTIDHLCRVRPCVNPDHMELVSTKVNVLRGDGPTARNARKTFCSRGHEFTPENTYQIPTGGRACRECRRLQKRTDRQTVAGKERHRIEEHQRNARRRANAPS